MRYINQSGVEVTEIRWDAPTTRADGSAYTSEDHGGYELGVVRQGGIVGHVSVPAAYNITAWPLDQLNLEEEGTYEVALRVVDGGGRQSVWSNTVTYTVEVEVPSAPANFTLA